MKASVERLERDCAMPDRSSIYQPAKREALIRNSFNVEKLTKTALPPQPLVFIALVFKQLVDYLGDGFISFG